MKYIIALISVLIAFTGCRTGKLPATNQNADMLYYKHHYYEAAEMYTKLIKKQKDDVKKREQTIKLADSYRQMNRYDMASLWYEKVIAQNPDKPEYLYLYADLLMSANDYAKALDILKRYEKEVPGDKRAGRKINMCEQALKLNIEGSRFNISAVSELNTQYNEYAPVYVKGAIYFTSDREGTTGGLKYPRLGTYYSDVFVSAENDGEFDKPKPMGSSINSNLNEGATSFNKGGSVMVLTQCSGQGYDSSCVLLISKKERGNWSKPEVIDFGIKGDYMFGQPAVSEDGKTIIFVSNIPGGYGGHDLYKTELKNGAWGRPQNLGARVNSSGDEMFPYLLDDKTLYFSSNGHPGFGALDIFVSYLKKEQWRNPTNLLPPVNSGGDDFGLTFRKDNPALTQGFLSSNRNSKGDDIFSFEIVTPPLSTVCGTVYDKKTKKPLANSRVMLTDLGNSETVYVDTDEKGKYCMKLLYEKDYKMDAYKMYYANNSDKPRISTRGLNFQENYSQDFYLEKWTVDEIEIEGILYDVDKADLRTESKEILDSLSSSLKIHYYLVVELSSHTDCRGSQEYNQELSQRRAESCVNYLISKGISRDRMVAKGYGETKLLNDCACEGEEGKGLDCSEAQHQENRRTSFQIIRTDFEPQDAPDFGTEYVDPED
ncbi:MAG: OmpA family protein [Bacteroidia bacterium]